MSGEVRRLALPILIGMVSDSVLSLVSLISVSRLSDEAVAATGLASYFFFIVNSLASIFNIGLLIVASQAYGAGKIDALRKAVNESLTLSLITSLILYVTSFIWLPPYINVMSGSNPQIAELATAYLSYRILSVPALMLNQVLATAYRAVDKPWPSAYASIAISASGCILIPSMALGFFGSPALGVIGAGMASAISQYVGLPTYLFFKLPFRIGFSIPSNLIVRVLAVGAPAALERVVASVGQNIYINAVAKSGSLALAAHNIGITVESLVINPIFAVSIATSAKTGHRVGANNVMELSNLLKEGIKVSVSWMGGATLLLIAISPFVGRFFTQNPEIAKLVTAYLILAAISELGLGVAQAFYGAFRGMGSTWAPLAISSATVILLRATLAQLLQPYYGVLGVWFTQITDMYGRTVASILLYKMLKNKLIIKVV
ncbi:MAG: hypothetical protein B7O98_00290 [Zestosphaera tikiterensis]|uniref:Multidrug-efflux transporter n=1 Tax=Zestosphaera tikiterensis TaxID=1973259 RepID=A0A2R7Y924_9CREN|nr:MAG: hypothetical protein B7O98_00290 [Zestosphaera tikiterensis]